MTILSGLKRLIVSFQSYKLSLAWFATLQQKGLAELDSENGRIVLSDKIPEEMMEVSMLAAETYGKTFLWLSKIASYARIVCIGIFAYIGYQVFFAQ